MNLVRPKNSTYTIVLLLVGLLMGTLLPLMQSMPAIAQGSVTAEVGDYNVDPGDSVDVPIMVLSGEQTVGAITVIVTYDAAVVNVTGCTVGQGLAGACNTANSGEVKLSAISFSGTSGDISAATMSFDAVGSMGQSTDLGLTVETIADSFGTALDVTASDGSISLGEAAPPTPTPTPMGTSDITGVVINEVFYGGNASADWIELKNTSTVAQDLSLWYVCSEITYSQLNTMTVLNGDLNLAPGEIVVLRAWRDLSNAADLGLYRSSGEFPSFGQPTEMADFVQWNNNNQVGRSTVAVAKGIWRQIGNGFDAVSAAGSGESIAFDGSHEGGGQLSYGSDYTSGVPTQGQENNAVMPTPTPVPPTPTPVPPTPTPTPMMVDGVLINAGSGSVNVGSSTSVDVSVAAGDDSVGAVTVKLSYDDAIIAVSECLQSVFNGSCNISTPGEILITGINLNGVSGDSVLATLKIDGVANGTTALAITEVSTIADSVGNGLSYTTEDGQVTVGGTAPTPTPMAPTPTPTPMAPTPTPMAPTPTPMAPTPTPLPDDVVIITGGSATTQVGATTTVDITIAAGSAAIGAVTLSLTYDDSLVLASACSQSTFNGSCNVSTAGEILVSGINLSGASGDSVLATVTFTGLADGTSLFSIINVPTLTDVFGVTLEHTTVDGQIVIGAMPTPTPAPTSTPTPMNPTPTPVNPTPTPVPPTPTPLPVGCGPLSQEAEAGAFTGNYTVGNDAGASGGQFAHVPDGSGNNGFGDDNVAEYCMTVVEAGQYVLKIDAKAIDGLNDSVFVTVDGEPANGYLWFLTRGNEYIENYLQDSAINATAVEVDGRTVFNLAAGEHIVRLHQREDGVLFDTIELEPAESGPIGCGTLAQEAEDGSLTGRFTVISDSAASGGSYVAVPDNSGNSSFGPSNTAEYCMGVETAGSYQIKARVYSDGGESNSFFVTVNDAPSTGYLFDTVSLSTYAVDYVSNRNGADPVIVDLPAGDTKLKIHLREDGTRLDTIELVLVDSLPTNNPPTIDAPGAQVFLIDDVVSIQVNASDPDNDTLTFSATGLPGGLSIDAATGLISGAPTTAGTFVSTVTVSDGAESASQSINWTISDNSQACGPLVQEAENASLFGDLVVDADVNASGGSYVHVPNGMGNDGFGSESKLVFCYDVTQAGTYQLNGNVYGVDGQDDSFFVTISGVNGQFTWGITRNTAYESDLMSDRTTGLDPVTFSLSAGQTAVTIWLREDGTRLDRLALELIDGEPVNNIPTIDNPGSQVGLVDENVSLQINANDIDGDTLTYSATELPAGLSINSSSGLISGILTMAGTYNSVITVSDGTDSADANVTWTISEGAEACGGLSQEAEDGMLMGNFVATDDANASNGAYAAVAEGAGNGSVGGDSQAVYCFNVAEAGDYRIAVSVMAEISSSNSFFVTVNGEPADGYYYAIDTLSQTYIPDYVSNAGGADPLVVTLPAGENQIIFYVREDGTRLDTIALEPATTEVLRSLVETQVEGELEAWGILGSLTDMSVYSADFNSGASYNGVAGLTVTLADAATGGSAHSQTATTDSLGRFYFDTMPVGDYVVLVDIGSERLAEPLVASDERMVEVSFGYSVEGTDSPVDVDETPAEQSGEDAALDGSEDDTERVFIPFLSRRNFKTRAGGTVELTINWACVLDQVLLHSPEADGHPVMVAIQAACEQ